MGWVGRRPSLTGSQDPLVGFPREGSKTALKLVILQGKLTFSPGQPLYLCLGL
jgi:hypothetical protein